MPIYSTFCPGAIQLVARSKEVWPELPGFFYEADWCQGNAEALCMRNGKPARAPIRDWYIQWMEQGPWSKVLHGKSNGRRSFAVL